MLFFLALHFVFASYGAAGRKQEATPTHSPGMFLLRGAREQKSCVNRSPKVLSQGAQNREVINLNCSDSVAQLARSLRCFLEQRSGRYASCWRSRPPLYCKIPSVPVNPLCYSAKPTFHSCIATLLRRNLAFTYPDTGGSSLGAIDSYDPTTGRYEDPP
jgi:hypothetical protein